MSKNKTLKGITKRVEQSNNEKQKDNKRVTGCKRNHKNKE